MLSSIKSNNELHQSSVKAELIKMLYQQAHTALLGVVATATGIFVIFFNEVPGYQVIIWLATICVLSFVRYISIRKFKVKDKHVEEIIIWGRIFSFFSFLSGVTWGVASVIFFTPENLQLFNILTLIIIAMSVGSMVALSAHPPSFYFFVVPAMLPMIWRYLGIEEQSYVIFGVLLFVFNFALFSIVRVNHKTLRDSIILRFENVGLIHQLTEQKEKAEQANIAKTKFLSSASHDMRQPIHAMGLFLGVLKDRVEKEDQKDIVMKIQKSSSALNSLLDSLLDISKLDAGVIRVTREPFSLNYLFESLESEFKSIAIEKGLKLSFVKTKLWVNTDCRLVERIIRNLVSNAIRYTNKGGCVVGCRRYQGKILMAVYDTGIGIDESDMQDVFREFHQLHNPERDRSKGLGLGLSIVERMADLLGMPLYTNSLLGKGSTFGIMMDAEVGELVPTIDDDSGFKKTFFDGRCVLVIDDEEEIRDSLTTLLESWHCEVVTTASGDEAVLKLQDNHKRPDLILADYRLRENETGIEAIHKVCSIYSNVELPAIIITGDTAPDRIKEARVSGYEVLHKPVAPDDLRVLLAGYLC